MHCLFSLPVIAPDLKSDVIDLSPFFAGYRGAFVLYDVVGKQIIRYNPSQCARRVLPCSTFKIPNSLIFLETGILRGENQIEKWDGRKRSVAAWNRDQTLKSAYAASVVWYYQRLAAKVPIAVMRRYLRALRYGNQTIPDCYEGGVPNFWLDGPLAISPDEQVAFLARLQQGDVPFSPRTQAIVRRIMVQQVSGSAVLRGKTGTEGTLATGVMTLGWYVGYVERAGRPYIFAANMAGGVNPSGPKVKQIVLRILKSRKILP